MKKYDDTYSYEIVEKGYDIYEDGKHIIEQHDPYGKVYDKEGTYEENCLLQLAELTKPQPEPPYVPTEEELLRSDVDYMALMLDVDLPSYEKEGD